MTIRNYIFVYSFVFLSDLSLIIFVISSITVHKNKELSEILRTWTYVNLSLTIAFLIWVSFIYMRFIHYSRRMYNVVFEAQRVRWNFVFGITMSSICMLSAVWFIELYSKSSSLNADNFKCLQP